MTFKIFPENPEFYAEEIQPLVQPCIEKYGINEWMAAVLTHDLHGHIGIYSILGVKMGRAALDYLGVKKGALTVRSEAGMHPPVSCLNDGLQVSTGATFGHGQISSQQVLSPKAAAYFTFKDKTLYLTPKKEVEIRLKNEIAEGTRKMGRSPEYWVYIEKLALSYWRDWDRTRIFEIQEFDHKNQTSYTLFSK